MSRLLTLRSLRRLSLLGLMLIVFHFAVTIAGVSLVYRARTGLIASGPDFSGIANTWQYIVLFLLTVTTVCRAIVSGSHLSLALDSRSWPVVQGTIVKSKRGRESELKVNYSYTVGDKCFDSNVISFGHSVFDSPEQRLRFAPEMTVDVFYDPAYPVISCLIPGMKKFQVLGEMLICFLLGAMTTFVALSVFS